MWSFETDPEYQADLDWADAFVREEIEPLEFVIPHVLDTSDPVRQELIPPLQLQVKERGLWATHLGPELGGQGHGQVKLGLLNEILGRCGMSSIICAVLRSPRRRLGVLHLDRGPLQEPFTTDEFYLADVYGPRLTNSPAVTS